MFGHPRILQGFAFNRDSFERECKIVYTWENFQEIFISIVGVRYWIQASTMHFREISLNRVCNYYSLSYCYFLLLESRLCFIEMIKIGKWSEISVYKIPVRFSWSVKELMMMQSMSIGLLFVILVGLFTIKTKLGWNLILQSLKLSH